MFSCSYQGEDGLDVVGGDLWRQKLDDGLDEVEAFVVVQLRRDQLLEDSQQRLQLVGGDHLEAKEIFSGLEKWSLRFISSCHQTAEVRKGWIVLHL